MLTYLQEAFPNLEIRTLTHLANGKAGAVYLANGEIVFKTHLASNTSDSNLALEFAALELLHGKTTLAVPKPLYFATLSNGREILGMSLLSGVQFTDEIYASLTEAEQSIIYAQLGEFLHEMHTLPAPRLQGATEYGNAPNSDYFYENYTDLVKNELTPTEQEKLAHIVQAFEATIHENPPPQVLNHGDLHFWNMHYNPLTKRLCGVLDFGLVSYHDPLNDMCYFWSDSVAKMLTKYPAPLGAGAGARHLFYNLCNLIEEAREELERGGTKTYIGYVKEAMWQAVLHA
ncbi:MAG: aminoglycoside phosphotransferase family protein [Defluviitaleaceae bacterium]|nr:aminoglycoside phosphotransferase family protein [Defluviitaleaceae bacterium]MCL2275720.1 aminoglycoside phosphotransferase family protein [Defluviitaleaceae bacterium]